MRVLPALLCVVLLGSCLLGSCDGAAEPSPDPSDVPSAVVAASAPCPEPRGGWVADPGSAGDSDLERGLAVTRRLDGYAGVRVDTVRSATAGFGVSRTSTVSVLSTRVTRDLPGARAAIRRVWGGGLCVGRADASE